MKQKIVLKLIIVWIIKISQRFDDSPLTPNIAIGYECPQNRTELTEEIKHMQNDRSEIAAKVQRVS